MWLSAVQLGKAPPHNRLAALIPALRRQDIAKVCASFAPFVGFPGPDLP
ncbi:hypothetical protein M2271_007953 [Streptomyces sp. LBL]|nr:hypothetical protein [Streptomyces sp. LBL]